MSSTSVFKSLRELFPQVDTRILRAISIEHEDDVNEAVEFILSEVLLPSSTAPEVSYIFHENNERESVSLEEVKGADYIPVPDDEPDSSLGMLNCVREAENRGLHSFVAGSSKDPVLLPPRPVLVDANTRSEQSREASEAIDTLHAVAPEEKNRGLHHLIVDNTEDPILCPPQLMSIDANTRSEQRVETLGNCNSLSLDISHLSRKGCDDIILTEHHTELSECLECDNIAVHTDGKEVFEVRDEENVSVHSAEQTILSTDYDKSESPMNFGSDEEDDINVQLLRSNELSGCSTDTCRSVNLIDLETVVDTSLALTSVLSMPVSYSDEVYQNPIAEEFEGIRNRKRQNFVSLDENPLEFSSNKIGDYSTLLTSLATRSGHTVCTDLLEESISDSKNSKRTMLSTLESIVSMMQEVEFFEEKAKQVKGDALVANQNIISRVEELKKTAKQAKDEKDMRAGEVYGERSILAAEARELQSRLLKMSEERSEYLSVTEEIFGSLEARKAAAQDEITAANIEKHEKEELVQEALKDHELMMNTILAESQKLQQEAEENNKLRDFLMDRGRVVDSLQGEIAIIFEDIISLKKKVNGHSPISKYLPSSWSSIGKAPAHRPLDSPDHIQSSSSSSTIISLINKKSPEEHQQVENSVACKNTLDDWEFCES